MPLNEDKGVNCTDALELACCTAESVFNMLGRYFSFQIETSRGIYRWDGHEIAGKGGSRYGCGAGLVRATDFVTQGARMTATDINADAL